MPYYSAIFRGHIRPNAVVGAASMFVQHNSVQLHRSPKLLLRPSSVVRSLHCRRSGGLVTHSQRSRVLSVKAGRGDASSSTLGLEWRASNLPYFQRQDSGYGRITYNDYESSDESDRDVGSSQSQQMVTWIESVIGCFVVSSTLVQFGDFEVMVLFPVLF